MEDHGRQIEITGKGTYYPNTNPVFPRVVAKESSARECGCDSGANYRCGLYPTCPVGVAERIKLPEPTRVVHNIPQFSLVQPSPYSDNGWGVLPNIQDSGERQTYASGSMRDPSTGKIKWSRITFGPMMRRWAQHLTTAEAKYPDAAPGLPNFMLISTPEEFERYKESAFRHFMSWFHGETDEDHASAVFFNINGVEIIKEKRANKSSGVQLPDHGSVSPIGGKVGSVG